MDTITKCLWSTRETHTTAPCWEVEEKVEKNWKENKRDPVLKIGLKPGRFETLFFSLTIQNAADTPSLNIRDKDSHWQSRFEDHLHKPNPSSRIADHLINLIRFDEFDPLKNIEDHWRSLMDKMNQNERIREKIGGFGLAGLARQVRLWHHGLWHRHLWHLQLLRCQVRVCHLRGPLPQDRQPEPSLKQGPQGLIFFNPKRFHKRSYSGKVTGVVLELEELLEVVQQHKMCSWGHESSQPSQTSHTFEKTMQKECWWMLHVHLPTSSHNRGSASI